MIEEILPARRSRSRGARRRGAGRASSRQEERWSARAVEKRRREFATGARLRPPRPGAARAAARARPGRRARRAALAGRRRRQHHPLRRLPGRAPSPATPTCARSAIDAEPHEPLPEGLLGDVASAGGARLLAELARTEPAVHWDRLLFSAKESVYKAWFPLAERWLGFEDAALTFDPAPAPSRRGCWSRARSSAAPSCAASRGAGWSRTGWSRPRSRPRSRCSNRLAIAARSRIGSRDR